VTIPGTDQRLIKNLSMGREDFKAKTLATRLQTVLGPAPGGVLPVFFGKCTKFVSFSPPVRKTGKRGALPRMLMDSGK